MRDRPLKQLAVAVLLISICGIARPAEEGAAAPELTATLLDGSRFSLSSARGSVVIVSFWASWCAPCREEMPILEAYYRKHRAEGLRVIAISMDDATDESRAREVMKGFSFPAALARGSAFDDFGRIWRIPLAFVIDRQGILRKDGWHGEPKIDEAALEATVTPLIRAR